MTPSLLFLSDPMEDYLADTLFHGLRSVLGEWAVDHPKRTGLYRSLPEERRASLYGHGFSIYGLLPELDVDRDQALERASRGEFDIVVVGTLWRDWHWWVELRRNGLPDHVRLAVLDGDDLPWMYPYGPRWFRSPQRIVLPRAHRHAVYFKRELRGASRWSRSLVPISFSYPEEKVAATVPAKTKDFPAHIVDGEIAGRVAGARTSYAFQDEAAYRADLQASRYGITARRGGWDALRHYEIAANGALPCFRRLERKPPRCAPHGLEPGRNCISYANADDLFSQLERMSEQRRIELTRGALAWAAANTTRRRAEDFLAAMGAA
jgi:hypothetical protein